MSPIALLQFPDFLEIQELIFKEHGKFYLDVGRKVAYSKENVFNYLTISIPM